MLQNALTFLRPTALFALSVAIAAPMAAQDLPREKIETLPEFIDATVPKLMEERRAPGVAVVVVHNGRIILSKGYGKARLNPDIAVDASRTVFRIGSVTKLFTAAAAVQLAEAGALDLHRDVGEYAPDIPLAWSATTHQLLTHTAGSTNDSRAPTPTPPNTSNRSRNICGVISPSRCSSPAQRRATRATDTRWRDW